MCLDRVALAPWHCEAWEAPPGQWDGPHQLRSSLQGRCLKNTLALNLEGTHLGEQKGAWTVGSGKITNPVHLEHRGGSLFPGKQLLLA